MVDFLSDVRLRILGTRSTLSELQGINTTILKDGALVYVTSNRDVYALLKDSTDTPDGANVVAPMGTPGRWFKTGLSQSAWQTQADWYVDEQDATGLASDSNTGDSASAPIASYAELTRRIEFATLEQTTTVHLISDVNPDSVFRFRGSVPFGSLLVLRGEAAVIEDTITLTTVQNIVVGTTRPFVQKASAWDLSDLDLRYRVTASSAGTQIGTLFWIEEIDSVDPTIAYVGAQPFFAADPPNFGAPQTIAAGDTVVAERLTHSGLLNWQGTGSVPWNNQGSGVASVLIDVGSDIPTNSQLVLGAPGGNFYAAAYGCLIRSSSVQTAGTSFEACRLGTTHSQVNIDLYSAYESFLTACSVRPFGGGVSYSLLSGVWSTFSNTSFASSRMVAGLTDGTVVPTIIRPGSISMWGWTGAAVQVSGRSLVRLLGACWGTSTRGGSTSFRVATGAYCSYPPGTPPTVIGTEANNCNVGGAAGSYAGLPIPFFNPANGAALVETAP